VQGEFWLLKTDDQRANAAAAVAAAIVNPKNPLCVKITEYKEKRSLSQNRLFHAWCNDISKQGKEHTPIEVRAIAKRTWGVPILVPADEVFATLWALIETQVDHEKQLQMLEIAVKVTSLFNVKQMSQFLNDMQNSAGGKYKLTDPSLYGLGKL